MAGITLLGATLRFYRLQDANLWEDEARTTWFQHFDIPGILFATSQDTHPPLSYILFHFWALPAGPTAFAFRCLAAALGILTIPVVAAIGRRLGGPTAGAISAFLLAISRFHVWWSEQIRMYSMVTLLAAASTYCFLAALDCWKRRPRRARSLLVLMAILNLVGLYTLYFYVMLILLESLFVLTVLITRGGRSLFGWWTGLHLASIAAFVPWLLYFRQHAITFSSRAVPRPAVSQFIEGSWSELTLGIDTDVARYRLLNIALAGLVIVLIAWLTMRDRKWPVAWWLAFTVISIPVTAYLITLPSGLFFSPTYQTRYQLPVMPALTVLVGWGIASLPKLVRIVPLAGLAAIGGVSLAAYYPQRHLVDDYQSLARLIQAYERPGDVIVVDPDSDAELFLFAYQGGLPWVGLPVNLSLNAQQVDGYFRKWTVDHEAVWLVQIASGHDAGAAHPVHDWLTGHLKDTMDLTSGNKLVSLYQPASAAPRTLDANFAPRFPAQGLGGFDQPIRDVRPGDVLNIALYGSVAPGTRLSFAGSRFSGKPFPGQMKFSIPINSSLPSGDLPIALQPPDGPATALSSAYVEPHATPPPPTPIPRLSVPVGESFEGRALLTSFDLNPNPAARGQALTVTLQWRCEQPFADDYTVFVHLLNAGNQVVAQRDSQPLAGSKPTVEWVPGETLNDPYQLSLPPSLAPGDYAIEVGMYLQSTGERLHLQARPSEDHVILGQLTVR